MVDRVTSWSTSQLAASQHTEDVCPDYSSRSSGKILVALPGLGCSFLSQEDGVGQSIGQAHCLSHPCATLLGTEIAPAESVICCHLKFSLLKTELLISTSLQPRPPALPHCSNSPMPWAAQARHVSSRFSSWWLCYTVWYICIIHLWLRVLKGESNLRDSSVIVPEKELPSGLSPGLTASPLLFRRVCISKDKYKKYFNDNGNPFLMTGGGS